MSSGRPVHIVGSVPLASADEVFRSLASALGKNLKRIPDGETGERHQWITWQGSVFGKVAALEPVGTVPIPGGIVFTKYGVRADSNPSSVSFGTLGYAECALQSYAQFRALKASNAIPQSTRFQVSLPTPLAVVFAFMSPAAVRSVWPAYERRLEEEIHEIVAAIPHDQLAIQWDVAIEVNGILENPAIAAQFPQQEFVEAIARISNSVPRDVELGIHLCYGDADHKHTLQPKDTRIMVDLANDLLETIAHPLQWIHLPVPIERDDASYFAPLVDLDRREFELYLGLIHLTDGIEGARRRIGAAKRVVRDIGVATECGWGRRKPETIPSLLTLHKGVSELD